MYNRSAFIGGGGGRGWGTGNTGSSYSPYSPSSGTAGSAATAAAAAEKDKPKTLGVLIVGLTNLALRSWPALYSSGMSVVAIASTANDTAATEAFIKAAIDMFDLPASSPKSSPLTATSTPPPTTAATVGSSADGAAAAAAAAAVAARRGVQAYTLQSLLTESASSAVLSKIDIVFIATSGSVLEVKAEATGSGNGAAANTDGGRARLLKRCIDLGKHVVMDLPAMRDLTALHQMFETFSHIMSGKQQPKVLWMDSASGCYAGPRMEALHKLIYGTGATATAAATAQPSASTEEGIGELQRIKLHLCIPHKDLIKSEGDASERPASFWAQATSVLVDDIYDGSRYVSPAVAMDALLSHTIAFVLSLMRGAAPQDVSARVVRRQCDAAAAAGGDGADGYPVVVEGEMRFPRAAAAAATTTTTTTAPSFYTKPAVKKDGGGSAVASPTTAAAAGSSPLTAAARPPRPYVVTFYVSIMPNTSVEQSCSISGSGGSIVIPDVLYPSVVTAEVDDATTTHTADSASASASYRQTIVTYHAAAEGGKKGRVRVEKQQSFPCAAETDVTHPVKYWKGVASSLRAKPQQTSNPYSYYSRGAMMASRYGGRGGGMSSSSASSASSAAGMVLSNPDEAIETVKRSWMVHQVLDKMHESILLPDSNSINKSEAAAVPQQAPK